MKKFLVFVLLLVCALSLSAALAEERCPDHPDAPLINANWVGWFYYDPWNHLIEKSFDKRCSECDRTIYFLDYTEEWLEPHHFGEDNVCGACGYERTAPVTLPTQTELMSTAQELGEQAVDSTAKVLYAGNLRASASADAEIVGKVYVDETYQILNLSQTYDGSIWYQVSAEPREAWVSAGLVTVLTTKASDGGEEPQLVGRHVVVRVGSGNARTAPGAASPKAGIVVKGDRYEILDCGYDQEGYLWYMIRLGNVNCWVSSGIVDLQN